MNENDSFDNSQLFGLPGLEKAMRQTIRWGQTVNPFFDLLAMEDFLGRQVQELLTLNEEIQQNSFAFSPFYTLSIPKPTGGSRDLAFPSIRDDIVAHALLNAFSSALSSSVSDHSYAYKLVGSDRSDDIFEHWGKSYSEFSSNVDDILTLDTDAMLIKTDISNYYPSINQEMLLRKLDPFMIVDPRARRLLVDLIRYETMLPDGSVVTGRGLPVGPAYGHLFANIYLGEFDQKWQQKTLAYSRYVDDIVVAIPGETDADSVIAEFDHDLHSLGLSRNLEKTEHAKIGDAGNLIDELRKKKYRVGLLSIQGGDDNDERLAEETFEELFGLTLLDINAIEQVSAIAPQLRFILRLHKNSARKQELISLSFECLKSESTDTVGIRLALLLITSEGDYYLDDRFIGLLRQNEALIQLSYLKIVIEEESVPAPKELLFELTRNHHLLVRMLAFSALRRRKVDESEGETEIIMDYQISHFSHTDSIRGAMAYAACALKDSSISAVDSIPSLMKLTARDSPYVASALIEFMSIDPDRELIELLWPQVLP